MSDEPKGLLVIEAGMPDFDERLKVIHNALGVSDPTTAETPTMRERLARAEAKFDWGGMDAGFEPWFASHRDAYGERVDAILREATKPNESMIDAMLPYLRIDSRTNAEMALVAALESILNETKD